MTDTTRKWARRGAALLMATASLFSTTSAAQAAPGTFTIDFYRGTTLIPGGHGTCPALGAGRLTYNFNPSTAREATAYKVTGPCAMSVFDHANGEGIGQSLIRDGLRHDLNSSLRNRAYSVAAYGRN